MSMRQFGEALVTFLVIMDPPSAVPVFLSVTGGLGPTDRQRAAWVATATSALVISMFALAGQQILGYLKVSVPAPADRRWSPAAAGGAPAADGSQRGARGGPTPEQRTSIAMVPLGTPLLAGPGAIVAAIVFTERSSGADAYLALFAALAAVHLVIWIALRFSGAITRLVRPAGILLLTRVAGMLLAAIAVQMSADGVRAMVKAG